MIEKNILAINKRYSNFKFVEIDKQVAEIVSAKSGEPTIVYKGKYLHSKFDPVKEGYKISNEINRSDLIVAAGFGLGYHIEAAIELYPQSKIVIFEPDYNLFIDGLKARDFTEIILNKNVFLIIGNSPQEIKAFLQPLKIKKVEYLQLANRVSLDIEFFNELQTIIRLYKERININRNTLIKFGKLWVKNQSKNLPYIGYKSDISAIFSKFNGIPGIIVSAGPSMEIIMPYLKEIQERFLILAVDTALQSLLDEGIEPDFVMSIDSQYWNARHLEGVKTDKTILIADSSIQQSAIREFKNRVYFTHSTFPLGKYFEKHRPQFANIASGGSVSTNIWDFALKLGLSEIYFIGQDLGYPGYVTHYKKSYFEKNMLITSTKTNTLETQSFKYIYNGYPTKVLSNNGDYIISDKRMGVYIDWFKEKLKLNNIKNCYNLSPFGCKIDGMEYKPLNEILNKAIKREEINEKLSILYRENDTEYLPSIQKAAESFSIELKQLVTMGNKASKLCKQIYDKYMQGEDIRILLSKLSQLDNNIINYSHSQTLSFIIEPFINEISDKLSASPIEALQISCELYNKIVTTGNLHLKYIDHSIEKIEKKLKES